MKNIYKNSIILIGSLAISFVSAQAQIIITEVNAAGSSASTGYSADWFELTNEGASAQSISGWKIDDNSHTYSSAVSLTGVSSIAAGQSVVFIEDSNLTAGQTDATLAAAFKQDWFGSKVPVGFTIGFYGGSGVGLSQTTDEVNIFDTTHAQVTGVKFNASTTTSGTFDNSILKLGTTVIGSDPTIATFSVAGVDGAFHSTSSGEIGSPGAVPEPGTYAMIVGSFSLLALMVRRRDRFNL